MGTLYECLREARLEQFYPAFRANGITRSEALINLGMPEFCALGITNSEDKRRLVELVNIIRSVHSSSLSDSPSPQRRNTSSRQQQSSFGASSASANVAGDSNPGSNRGTSHARSRARPNSRGASHHENSAAEPRDTPAQDRVPNFSVASYMDMVQYMSDSSDSGGDEDQSEDDQPVASAVQRNISSPSTVRSSMRSPAVERIKHSKAKGYNYGVHKVSTPTKTKTSRSGSHRNTGDDKIKVCVRKRPLTRREQRQKEDDVVGVESTNTLIVNEPKVAVDLKAYTLQHEFIFDEVFDDSCSNEDVYIRAARPLISCIFNGGTATCFAYGQTGAGKTHTMLGDENVPGLYLLAGQDIFSIIQSGQYGRGLHVWVSFFEIYCGQLFDLLNRRNRLHAREDGSRQVCIAGLTETEATSVNSLVQTLEYGNSVRSKGATGVNPDSSRSHAILQLDIRNNEDVKIGKISFIDLAGSERASDVTDTDKQTRMEGAEINQSLLALKECIRSIDQDSRHTPFRQSKLTHILKDSFIGNSRTCMIANISPTQTACENTLNTLRYADRVKELKRDSVRSSSIGQAMNLLMNIPPTAPSIFHPSNVLSTSTPMRNSTQARRDRNSAAELVLDPSETPIRGHNMPRRPGGKESSRHRQGSAPTQSSTAKSRTEQLSVVSPTPQVPRGSNTRSSTHATAASQGASAPPPDASPSESDHTDTDSCNVTHPTYTKPGPSGRQLPVVKSTDTEFDFPTSDFNNIDDFNDLNRSDSRQKEASVPNQRESQVSSQRGAEDQCLPAAAAAETVVSSGLPSVRRTPLLKPVVYSSTDPDVESPQAGTSASGQQASGTSQKFPSPSVASSVGSKQPPKKAAVELLDSSDDSVDDEDLLASGPSSMNVPQGLNNLTAPASRSGPTVSVSKANPVSFMNKHLMIPLPADSSDLTKFTQRTSLKPPAEPPSTATNDLSAKQTNTASSPAKYTPLPQKEEASHRPVPSPHIRTKSPSSRTKSPISKQLRAQAEKPLQQDIISEPAGQHSSHQSQEQPQPMRKLPKPGGRSSAPHSSSSSATQGRSSPQTASNKTEDSAQDSKVRRHSDGSESGRHHKTSPSPTGESDDSTDSIRASLSDQGHSGYRHHKELPKSSMRKERSDPMLALNMQRKKQTLPDPEKFSKMLTRSNTPKGGLAHRDVSWKAVHNELPSPKANQEDVTLAGGDCHSEPSSLIATGFGSHEEINTDQQEHFSDGNNYSSMKAGRRESQQHKSSRGKQLPQVPGFKSDHESYDSPGTAETHNTPNNITAPASSGSDLPFRINSAIVTEKLASGAVFSPIHPQPVTCVGTNSVPEPATSSSVLLQPTPVTASTTNIVTSGGVPPSGPEEIAMAVQEARMQLVSAHEDQLATITSLCKYEMRLLLNAKKVSGRRGFDDYLRRVNDILQQKMAAISSLQDQISSYRGTYSQSSSVASSVAASVSDASSNLIQQNIISHK